MLSSLTQWFESRVSLDRTHTQTQGPQDRPRHWLQHLPPHAECPLAPSPHKYQSGRCPWVTGPLTYQIHQICEHSWDTANVVNEWMIEWVSEWNNEIPGKWWSTVISGWLSNISKSHSDTYCLWGLPIPVRPPWMVLASGARDKVNHYYSLSSYNVPETRIRIYVHYLIYAHRSGVGKLFR